MVFVLGFPWFGGRCGGNCRGAPIRRPWQSSQRRGWFSRHTAPRLSLRRRKVRLSPFPPDDENCARSLAPPLQRKPTPLGFALGAAFGGLYNIRVRGLGISLLGAPLLRWGSSCAVGGQRASGGTRPYKETASGAFPSGYMVPPLQEVRNLPPHPSGLAASHLPPRGKA